MAESFNIYCDESCHLEHDNSTVMVLGAVWCPVDKTPSISRRVREIKIKHKLNSAYEIKWTKISTSKIEFYREIINYFFDDDDLHFRAVLIPDKRELNHKAFGQNHDDWYYKMCFSLLEPIIDPKNSYRVYLDIKDTRSERKRKKLEEVLRSKRHDHEGSIIDRVQQIRSHESEPLQLADLLIGAIGYSNRQLTTSISKQDLIEHIRHRSRKRLDMSTWLRESKFNLFRWQARGGVL